MNASRASAADRVDRVVTQLAFVLALVGATVAIYVVDYLPTNDGPHHAYGGFVRSRIGHAPFASVYAPTWPLSSWGFELVFAVLEKALGWREAFRASLAIAVDSWVVGCAVLVSTLPRPRRPVVALAGAGALQWALYMGFVNWLLGVGFALAALGVGMRDELPTRKRFLWVGLLLAFGSVCHPFGAQFAGLGLLVHALVSLQRPLWAGRLRTLALVGFVPVVVTLGTVIALDGAELSPWLIGHRAYVAPWSERLRGFAWFYTSGPWYRWAPTLVLGLFGVSIALIRVRRLGPVDRVLLALAIVATAGALFVPRHGMVWQNFSPRFIPLALVFGALLLPVERVNGMALRGVCYAAFMALLLVSTVWGMGYHRRLREASGPWLDALREPPRAEGSLLPIVLETTLDPERARQDLEVPFARPHVNAGLVMAMQREAVSPYTFSVFPAIHVIRNRETFPRVPSPAYFQDVFHSVVDRRARSAEFVRLASYGAFFDEVFVEGPDDIVDVFLSSGYRAIHRGNRSLLARFEACPTKVRLDGQKPVPMRATVALGWDPEPRTVFVERDVTLSDWPAEVDVHFASCGAVRINVSAGEAELRCLGGDAEHAIHGKGGTTLRCDLVAKTDPR